MQSRRQATSNLGFFSKSFSLNGPSSTPQPTQTTNVVVKKRFVEKTPVPRRGKGRRERRHSFRRLLFFPGIVKRPRLSPTSTESRAVSAAPSEAPSTRTDSVAPSRTGSPTPLSGGARWIDEHGRPGSELLSSEITVRNVLKTYKAYFKNPSDPEDTSFEPHSTNYPITELEYPNSFASERFVLLEPKDKDHYAPILCLQKTVHIIVEYYLTPEQRTIFGQLPNTSLSHLWDDADHDSPDSNPSETLDQSQLNNLLSTLLSSSSLLSSFLPSSSSSTSSPTFNFPRRLQSAINRRNGPQFLELMDGINTFFRALKYPRLSPDLFDNTPPNGLISTAKSKGAIPYAVLMRIVDETYQRAVGPEVDSLKNYQAFTAETYGELMPSFVSRIIKETKLNAESLFIDLGSGVGNTVCQASLETGCTSFGVELLNIPAAVAQTQLQQLKIRCRMWGVSLGDVELEHNDMLKSRRVDALLSKADVVLVNNKVFDEALNESIKGKFLDLKEGAFVVSLRPFSQPKSSLTSRNVDDISRIFQVREKKFPSGSVSWTGSSDFYYVHQVNRDAYARDRTQYHSSRASSVRSTRSRR
ncbi:hypothetical protein QCA50_008538 [Cerrena zonata]|uniref:Histone-lysine N-methyltransferase, H3 lysine-79 specific n=1 Tax=Cerrena zonata TaxID=2478898 RepID=A0AAW0G4B5_9APHY